MRSLLVAALGFAAAACDTSPSPLEVRGAPSRTVEASLGQEVSITLSTVGPGEYVSPPTIQGVVVEFMDVSYPEPHLPSGVSQRFRFKAVAIGESVLRFTHTGRGEAVEDTVIVR